MMGEGACTTIADTERQKDSENRKKVLMLTVLLAGIVPISIDTCGTLYMCLNGNKRDHFEFTCHKCDIRTI